MIDQPDIPKTNITEYLAERKQTTHQILQFNPNYDIAQLASKLEDFSDFARNKLIAYELYNVFKPYVIERVNGFSFREAK